MIEFDCCECRRHIVAVVAEQAPTPPLCAECLTIPGWHEDPKLRAMLDPRPQLLNPATSWPFRSA